MKLLTNTTSDVKVTGPHFGNLQLGIEQTNFGLAIQILMELYKNPIGSIVRELGANAYDAMRAAGKRDAPIEIILPHALSPNLIVRDSGNGMDYNFITQVYSNLLSSTKRDDNEGIGGFGVGSKSPLGYSNAYSVVTVSNKRKISFVVSRNGGFCLLGDEITDEEDGTTVTVPVKSGDYQAFKDATQWLRYMDPPPLIDGVPMRKEPIFLEGTYQTQGDIDIAGRWFIADDSTTYDKDPQILLGPIPYDIELKYLPTLTRTASVAGRAGKLRIEVPIGSLEVTPSRESLQYSTKTKQVLEAVLTAVTLSVKPVVEKRLGEYEYHIDARKVCAEYNLSHWWGSSNDNCPYTKRIELPYAEGWKEYSFKSYSPNSKVGCRDISSIYYPERVIGVFIDDNPLHPLVRIRECLSGFNASASIIVGPPDSKILGDKLFPIVPLSTLPLPDKVPTPNTRSSKSTKVLNKLDRGHVRALLWNDKEVHSEGKILLYTHTTDTTIPLDGEGYYIPMSGGKVVHEHLNGLLGAYQVNTLIGILQLGDDQPLYVVSPQTVSRLGPGYKNIIDAVHEYLTPWLVWWKKLSVLPLLPNSLRHVTPNNLEPSYLCEYMKLMYEARTLSQHMGDINHLYSTSFYNWIPEVEGNPILQLRDLVIKVYPMLWDREFNHCSWNVDHVVDYALKAEHHLQNTSCRLSDNPDPAIIDTAPSPLMDGKELMIHYYQRYSDVRRYYSI